MDKMPQNFSQAQNQVYQEITIGILKALAKKIKPEFINIEYPPNLKLGDFSVSCFTLAKMLKRPPVDVAKDLATKIKPVGLIGQVKAVGPYLNFFVDRKKYAQAVLTQISKEKEKYGSSKLGKGKRVMVEYFSPNTNKPLTIGHVRNICLGWSVVQLLKFLGYKVIEATLYNDRGIAIAKTIVGYLKWGENKTPKQAGLKPDHFVGSFYVKFCQEAQQDPELEKQAQRVLEDWEAGKKEVKQTWQKLMGWVLEGFDQTLKKFGVGQFDEKYYESEYYQHGKEIVEQGLKKGVFIKDNEGVILAPLQKYGRSDKIVLRPNQTSLYITQDLYLAYLKDKYKPDESIYVVGDEQDLYLQQLFKILELLGFENTKKYYHLSYGMIRLPGGRIKSREGLIEGTGADDLMANLESLAANEIRQRFKDLSQKEVTKRSGQISLAALKFYILAVSPKSTMVFDPKQSLAFAGRTGPYLQYVHARISSIFAKAKPRSFVKADFSVLTQDLEFELVKFLARFPEIILLAAQSHDPSALADYLYELAKSFSLFYEQLPILKAEAKIKAARLTLIEGVKDVLAQGLDLLGIEAPEKM